METKNSQAPEKLPKKKLPRRENPCFSILKRLSTIKETKKKKKDLPSPKKDKQQNHRIIPKCVENSDRKRKTVANHEIKTPQQSIIKQGERAKLYSGYKKTKIYKKVGICFEA